MRIIHLIKKHKTIYVFGHNNPDGDCLGAQSAVKAMIKNNFPGKKVFAPIKKAQTKWLFNTYPNDPTPDQNALKKDLIILVDVNHWSRTDYPELQHAKNLVLIDHHIYKPENLSPNIGYWIEEKYGSVCEMLAVLFIWQGWKWNQEIANALLTGIITDTGNLKFNSTKSRTLYICGYLLAKKAQLVEIHNKINHLSSEDVATFRFFQENYIDAKKFKYFIFKPENQKKLPWVTETHQFKRYLHFLKNIDNTKVCATFLQFKENGLINCSLRSKKVDVNSIAIQFNGGGHRLASGIKLKNWNQVENLINVIKMKVEND